MTNFHLACTVVPRYGCTSQVKIREGVLRIVSGLAHERCIVLKRTRISENHCIFLILGCKPSDGFSLGLYARTQVRLYIHLSLASDATLTPQDIHFKRSSECTAVPRYGCTSQVNFFTSFARESQMFFLSSLFWTAVCQDFWFKIRIVVLH